MIEQYEQTLDKWIANIINVGDDDALFASGYLQGHFAVILSELETENANDNIVYLLDDKMQQCLLQAKEELTPDDYQLVINAWLDLKQYL